MRALRLLMLCAVASSPALGQQEADEPAAGSRRSAPLAGTWAVGGDLGFSNPIGDDDFDTEFLAGGYGEYFFNPRLSTRFSVGFISFDGPDLPPPLRGRNDVDVLMVLGNVSYHWEGRTVRPFVLGGVGLYDYDVDIGDGDLELGAHFGGGASFWISNSFAIKVEGTFHGTSASEPDSFFNATAGVRWRF